MKKKKTPAIIGLDAPVALMQEKICVYCNKQIKANEKGWRIILDQGADADEYACDDCAEDRK